MNAVPIVRHRILDQGSTSVCQYAARWILQLSFEERHGGSKILTLVGVEGAFVAYNVRWTLIGLRPLGYEFVDGDTLQLSFHGDAVEQAKLKVFLRR